MSWQTLLAVAAVMMTTTIGSGTTKQEPMRLVYELYSWRVDTTQEWQFCVLSGVTSHVKTPEEVFDSNCVVTGLDGLETQLTGLPEGSEIVWMAAIRSLKRDPKNGHVTEGPPTEGMERLSLPAKAVIDKVRALTKRQKLRLEVLTSSGSQPSVIVIDNCSSDRSFTVVGKKTALAADVSPSASVTLAARAASEAGIRKATVKSMCKLRTLALATYCDAFAKEHVRIVSVIVPVGNPGARRKLRCGDTSF